MWGKIMIPMYRLWLHGSYGLYGPRCPLSPERPLNLITHSLTYMSSYKSMPICRIGLQWVYVTTVIWQVTSLLANDNTAFIWKLCCHWLKGLWQCHIFVVIQAKDLTRQRTWWNVTKLTSHFKYILKLALLHRVWIILGIPGQYYGYWCFGFLLSCMTISMGKCKKDVTPVRWHWSYVFLALTHRYLPTIFTTAMSLCEAPGAKTLSRALLFRAILCIMGSLSVHHGVAYRVSLTYDCVNKPKPVKQVIVAAMVILSNRCCVWTMHLCMNSVKFVLEAPGASVV